MTCLLPAVKHLGLLKEKKEREKAESEADKGLLGIRTSYVPGANQISLYMPMALNMNDTVDYQTPELGAAGAWGTICFKQCRRINGCCKGCS